jgi:hypothetical protein
MKVDGDCGISDVQGEGNHQGEGQVLIKGLTENMNMSSSILRAALTRPWRLLYGVQPCTAEPRYVLVGGMIALDMTSNNNVFNHFIQSRPEYFNSQPYGCLSNPSQNSSLACHSRPDGCLTSSPRFRHYPRNPEIPTSRQFGEQCC